jgi:hypothetical protein
VKVLVPVEALVIVTENHGGYTAGRCVVCGKLGWLAEYPHGLPFGSTAALDNTLHHAKVCPVGQALDEKGKVKE